jgi:rhodanese-related sulfurtransferase
MRARRTASVIIATVVALTGAACSSPGPSAPAPRTASASNNAPASAPAFGATLNAQQFKASLAVPGVTVVDVRTPDEYAGGHIEGARLADINGDFEQAVAGLDRSAPYAVYCRSGNRSAAALTAMKKLGFTNAWHLDGGIGAWQAAGNDVVKG